MGPSIRSWDAVWGLVWSSDGGRCRTVSRRDHRGRVDENRALRFPQSALRQALLTRTGAGTDAQCRNVRRRDRR